MTRTLRTVVMLVLAIAAPAAAVAQTPITTAAIEGVVVDTSGGVLPGADVEVRNVETNIARTIVTDSAGRFTALQLRPGHYTVTVTLSGFATLVQEDIAVTVGQSLRLTSQMRPSGIAETVNVTVVATPV